MTKGIFCLEGNWFGRGDRTTVEPVLHLLEKMRYFEVPYLHYDVATRKEFKFRLKEWQKKPFKTHPILYLGFHGAENKICLARDDVLLDDIEGWLGGSCENRVIYFASCLTVDVHGHRLNRFLEATRAFAICGYKAEIDWLISTIYDAIFLSILPRFPFDQDGRDGLDGLFKAGVNQDQLNQRRAWESELRELEREGRKLKKQKRLRKKIGRTGDLEIRLALRRLKAPLDFQIRFNPNCLGE